jgi:tRNA synthetases class I (I, L, M and V)
LAADLVDCQQALDESNWNVSLTNRYKHLHGKFVIHPVDGRRLPIVCDAESVDMALGTGAVKVFHVLAACLPASCCCAELLQHL